MGVGMDWVRIVTQLVTRSSLPRLRLQSRRGAIGSAYLVSPRHAHPCLSGTLGHSVAVLFWDTGSLFVPTRTTLADAESDLREREGACSWPAKSVHRSLGYSSKCDEAGHDD